MTIDSQPGDARLVPAEIMSLSLVVFGKASGRNFSSASGMFS